MVFMHHIIARPEFGKILDLLSVIPPAAFLLFLSAENIRLRNHDELKHRIFIPFCHIAVGHHYFSRIDAPFHILAVKTAQIIVSQIFSQSLRPCSGTGQKNHPAAAALQALQIPCQQFETVVVRIHALCLNAVCPADMEVPAL